ncbi:MAG: hypothetical protein Q4F96_03445 [Bacillota bacterium]|nr:hypothetical protein [Bacillota bacterium]
MSRRAKNIVIIVIALLLCASMVFTVSFAAKSQPDFPRLSGPPSQGQQMPDQPEQNGSSDQSSQNGQPPQMPEQSGGNGQSGPPDPPAREPSTGTTPRSPLR